jgi:hypothetical protein
MTWSKRSIFIQTIITIHFEVSTAIVAIPETCYAEQNVDSSGLTITTTSAGASTSFCGGVFWKKCLLGVLLL